jgi:hypothetical protein
MLVVSEREPDLLGKHIEQFVGLLCEDSSKGSYELAKTLAAVATEHPTQVQPYVDSLRKELKQTNDEFAVGYLLQGLLAVNEVEENVLTQLLHEFDEQAFAPALGALTERYPEIAMRILMALRTDLEENDGYETVRSWIDELAPSSIGDVRVSVHALDLIRRALQASDSWTREDSAKAMATVAALRPRRIANERDHLVKALDDWSIEVAQLVPIAQGYLGDKILRRDIEPFTSHPRPEVRDVAESTTEIFA